VTEGSARAVRHGDALAQAPDPGSPVRAIRRPMNVSSARRRSCRRASRGSEKLTFGNSASVLRSKTAGAGPSPLGVVEESNRDGHRSGWRR
jgi:hypothetical protein